ncbi:MAG: flagellar basal-body rod protein FlgG [Azospirillaceae bacterium]|nr:flagellar basal-body rod protein FlgG [Azospirillaceae bacterium]
MRSLSIGATGMLAQQLNIETISNNISNMSTTGFKRQRAEFQDLLYQSQRRVGSTTSDAGTVVPVGIQIGAGVKPTAVYRINEQGSLSTTNNSLDIAVNGQGYFQITIPGSNTQTAYTRAGSFQLDSQGQIVTADGYVVLPGLTIPANTTAITVSSTGVVQATVDGQVTAVTVGQFQMANFTNPAGLDAIGDNLLLQTTASGQPTTGTPGSTGFGKLVQGSLEESNVNIVTEITNLISAQRAYEMNSRVIQAADDLLTTLAQMK